jgi:hypothetical protein
MTTSANQTPAAPARQANTSWLSGIFAKAFANMSPAERKATLADANLTASILGNVAKATDIMDGKKPDIEEIPDVWTDGPAEHAATTETGGPGSRAGGGTIPVGESQSARGGGADKMERRYSRPAPQGPYVDAAGALGASFAMKAVLKAVAGLNSRIDLLTTVAQALIDDVAAAKAAADKAIRLAKAGESESGSGHETEDEESDEEAKQEESGSGTEIEITNELEEDDEAESDDDKAAASKARAAKSRVLAKQRLRLAKGRLLKAAEADIDGNKRVANRHRGVAQKHVEKAVAHQAQAKALRPTVLSLVSIEKSIANVGKALKTDARNQTNWPATNDKDSTVKAETPSAAAAEPTAKAAPVMDAAALSGLQTMLKKAVEGQGMLQLQLNEVMGIIGGMPRGSGVSPLATLALAKAKPEGLDAVAARVNELAEAGVIDSDIAERTHDTIGYMRAAGSGMNISPMILKSRIDGLPENVRVLFAEMEKAA